MKKPGIVLGLLCVLLLTSCSGGSSDGVSSVSKSAYGVMTNDAYGEDIGYDVDLSSGVTYDESQSLDEKLVYNCYVSIETLTYGESKQAIRERVKEYGGLIQSETETDNDHYWYENGHNKTTATLQLDLTARIPSEKYNDFLTSIEGVGKVVSQNSSVDNISESYYDTSTMIESLKIQEKRLLDMYENAGTIDEMITVESRLTEVQSQLNQYNTRLSRMDTDVKYATVQIHLQEVINYTPEPERDPTFIERLGATIEESWTSFLMALEDLLFTSILALPYLIIYGIIGAVIALVVRLIRGYKDRKRGKKEDQ